MLGQIVCGLDVVSVWLAVGLPAGGIALVRRNVASATACKLRYPMMCKRGCPCLQCFDKPAGRRLVRTDFANWPTPDCANRGALVCGVPTAGWARGLADALRPRSPLSANGGCPRMCKLAHPRMRKQGCPALQVADKPAGRRLVKEFSTNGPTSVCTFWGTTVCNYHPPSISTFRECINSILCGETASKCGE